MKTIIDMLAKLFGRYEKKCPLCDGTGLLLITNYYYRSKMPEVDVCDRCNGKGVIKQTLVWKEE